MATPPRSAALSDAERAGHLPDRGAGSGDDVATCHGREATARFARCSYPPVTSCRAADPGGHPGGGERRRAGRPPPAGPLPRRVRAPRGRRDVRRHRVGRQGPAQEPAHRRRRHPGAGARRGLRRRDGVEHQLQHGVDARSSSRCRRSGSSTASAARARGQPATPCPTTWSARTPRASCCGSARRSATGAPATGSPCTATPSTTRIRRPTTTRCSPPTSGSGGSRPTSAGSPT